VKSSLCLGLVTHAGTRFPDADTDSGLVHRVAAEWADQDRRAQVVVCRDDMWTVQVIPLTGEEVAASTREELRVERQWREFLRGGKASPLDQAALTVRHAVRSYRRRQDPQRAAAMLRRLVNIELAHLKVMEAAVASGCDWSLIVEDDAAAGDAFPGELMRFVDAVSSEAQPQVVSLSNSFAPRDLGIDHLLKRTTAVAGLPWSLFQARLPVTNTVCATLYRTNFLRQLLRRLHAIDLRPVIPIDFKVNRALMAMSPQIAEGDFWLAWPGPVTQRSGVPTVIA